MTQLCTNNPPITIEPQGKCLCGEDLPWHLHDLGINSHTCSCGRSYEPKGKTFVYVGDKPNPFTAFR